MIILCDTREQKPIEFNHEWVSETLKTSLNVGDYACEYLNGKRCSVYFERKSLSDLFGTLTSGYDRFKREILRAKENNIQLYILIEGSFSKVLKGHRHSKTPGISIVRSLWTLWFRYEIHHKYCGNRNEMSNFMTEFFIWYGKQKLWEKEGGVS